MQVPEVKIRRAPHRPRRTRRARRGRPQFSEIDVDLARSKRAKEEVYADIRARARRAAGVGRHRPADRAPARPHAVGRAGADRRSRSSARTSTPCARLAETLRERLAARSRPRRPAGREAGAHPAAQGIHVDYERAALYGITPAALTEALEGLSNGRVVSQIVEGNRRFDVVMRLSDEDRSTTGLRRSADLDARRLTCRCGCSPRSRRRDGPNQIQRENGQRRIVVYGNGDGRARHGGDRRRHPRASSPRRSCRRAIRTQLGRHVPGAGRGGAA